MLRLFALQLDDHDLAAIEGVPARAQGPAGDVYALERAKGGGRHAAIMEYDLNKV